MSIARTDINAVLDAIGGTAAASKLFGKSMQAVSNWRDRGRFPPRTYLTYGAILRERGIDAPPELWGLETISRSRMSEPAE